MPKHKFKKGNKYGKGRPKVTEEERRVNKLTRTQFKNAVSKYLKMTKKEMEEEMKNPEVVSLDMAILAVLSKAIDKGDEKRLNWMLEQLFGKLKETTDLNVSGSLGAEIDVTKLSMEQLKFLKSLYESGAVTKDSE